ncbi:MAG: carboxylating nicotinate-nucleotide diphosphorylase [Candidatus Rariloculaceae bacterium]
MDQQSLALPPNIGESVARALDEDIGKGDLTADLISEDATAAATVTVQSDTVLCGQAWFDATFRLLDKRISVTWHFKDSAALTTSQTVCDITGPARAILTGERTALNFLQTLSGTATTTRNYVAAVAGTKTRILDTRKTIPGLRLAQKYAVRCGGGENHRLGLYDAILIKENHIAAAGSIKSAVESARRRSPNTLIEIEVETLNQLHKVLDTDIDRILLDNFSLASVRQAVSLRDAHEGTRKDLEASGRIELEGIPSLAKIGVDFISAGALTKNIVATDFSLRFI